MPPTDTSSRSSVGSPAGTVRSRLAERIAETDALPTALRAIFGYYGRTGELSLGALRIKRRVDGYVDDALAEAFSRVERSIAEEFGIPVDDVDFEFETKLTMPAELTLGYVYQRATTATPEQVDPVTGTVSTSLVERVRRPFGERRRSDRRERLIERSKPELDLVETAEDVTDLVLVALVDGDMRDALNDGEFDDFVVGFDASGSDRERIAELAQAELQAMVEDRFASFPPAVRTAYRDAVRVSERHQERDPQFRALMAAARDGDREAVREIEAEYKFADFEDPPAVFSPAERSYPYLKTQYGRVGVIYDGMVDMYRAAGVEIEPTFERSIVFAIIGAQIWLDDVDDYEADLRDTQLTPVTAEYLLQDSDREAYRSVLDITDRYLTAAERYAASSNSPLTGIGADYILRSGSPDPLPK
jgi:hypothetical protein